MTLHFFSVASASCWEVLFCCWHPCPPGKHAKSNSPSQLQQPLCTKLPLMFRAILEGSMRLFFQRKITRWLTLTDFFKHILFSMHPLSPVCFPLISLFLRSGTILCCYDSRVLDIVKILASLRGLSVCREILSLQTPFVPLQGTQRGLFCFRPAGGMMRYVCLPLWTLLYIR